MFAGIVQAMGIVSARRERGGDVELVVAADGLDLRHTRIGDSIAVSGVCLTVTADRRREFRQRRVARNACAHHARQACAWQRA